MQADLIYDVGMNDGKDTAYYLWKGYRVVAVECDPTLIDAAKVRFKDAIGAGRLTLLNLAVGPENGTAPFWICDEHSEWNSFDKDAANSRGSTSRALDVPVRRFAEVLREHGVPYYLKVDIEGFDHFCIADIDPADAPKFCSFELTRVEDLHLPMEKGYTRYKLIGQRGFSSHTAARTKSLLKTMQQVTAQSGRVRMDELKGAIRKHPALHSMLAAPARALRSVRGSGAPGPAPTAVPQPQAATPSAWSFEMGASGPFGADLPGEWSSIDEAAYAWLDYWLCEGRFLPLAGRDWFDLHAMRPEPGHEDETRDLPLSLRR